MPREYLGTVATALGSQWSATHQGEHHDPQASTRHHVRTNG